MASGIQNRFRVANKKLFQRNNRQRKKSVLTDIFTLNGTSEEAMAFLTPLFGADGTYYGICGFEISKNYFKDFFTQPTKLEQLTCTFSQNDRRRQNRLRKHILGRRPRRILSETERYAYTKRNKRLTHRVLRRKHFRCR